MTENTPIMMNDSLARQMASQNAYDRSLGEMPQRNEGLENGGLGDGDVSDIDYPDIDFDPSFMDSFSNFLSSIPTLVWIVLGIFVAAIIIYWTYRSGIFKKKDEDEDDNESEDENAEDDIRTIDFDHEMDEALRNHNYADIVRLVYLRTLHTLDDRKAIKWHISKTPSQYADEVNLAAFDKMTYHFLYVRYGKFPATSQMSDEMQDLRDEVLNTKGGAA